MAGLVRYPPLPVRDDWAPSYLAGRPGASNRDFAFHLADPEGCYPRPPGYHGAVDWFAPAGTEVRAPWSGVVTRVLPGGDTSGAVFGGVLDLSEPSGMVWVMRHVQPLLPVGAEVQAGDVVAKVHRWDGGSEHLHLECWRSKAGGYAIGNMIDPQEFTWDASAAGAAKPPQRAQFWMEELPHTSGGSGPVVAGSHPDPAVADRFAAKLRRAGAQVSTVDAIDGRRYVLTWAAGTYGERFRWGPWGNADDRDRVLEQRELVQGRRMRPYRGQDSSLYPWPKEG